MKTRILPFAALAFFALLLNSCTKDVITTEEYYYSSAELNTLKKTLNLAETPPSYSLQLPSHFGGPSQTFINKDKAILGRVLFYDKALSKNEAVSCASCHDQSRAFADPVAFSEGFEGELTKRNSFALGAVASFTSSYNGSGGGPSIFPSGAGQLFWDNRASTIQEQSMQTLQDPIEMGMDLNLLVERVKSKDYYQVLFDKAFEGNITQGNILISIAEFINAMVVSDTRFDKGIEKHFHETKDFDNFTAAENLGKRLFIDNCATCHGPNQVRVNIGAANNGLDLEYSDQGVGALTNNINDNGVFKVPLLRNIELTGPYMHDGRFETLEEVIEHYNSGVQDHRNLHPRLQEGFNNGPKRLNLSAEEKAALVSFLKTLTDTRITSDERFSDPFKQ